MIIPLKTLEMCYGDSLFPQIRNGEGEIEK